MALTPTAPALSIGQNIPVVRPAEQPTRTYAVDFASKRVRGYTDRIQAMQQAIIKILETERFQYLIYSWHYGSEMRQFFGAGPTEALSRVQNVIEEALLADSRIAAITDFQALQVDKRTVRVQFTAQTIFGDAAIERVVDIG